MSSNNAAIVAGINSLVEAGYLVQAIEMCKAFSMEFAPFIGGISDEKLRLVEEALKINPNPRHYSPEFGGWVVTMSPTSQFSNWEVDGGRGWVEVSLTEILR